MTHNQLFDNLHPDFLAANQLVYKQSGFITSKPIKELESEEYGACVFEINNRSVKFRVAKITPKKVGQFVTLWKRIGLGPIMPYDIADPIDLFVVSVRNGDLFGQFVFPKAVLDAQGILSRKGQEGKRAMRVYPPWDKPQNRQAQLSQYWQLKYFFEISHNSTVDQERVQRLFSD